MGELNRQKRQTLRRIQEYINRTRQRHGLHSEQAGVMDIYYHATDAYGDYNYVTPRRGVAWVPGTDVLAALDQLEIHHTPRLELLEGLFPPAFHRLLEGMKLTAQRYPLLTYGMIPDCDQTLPVDEPAPLTPPHITTLEANDPNGLALWLRMHRRPSDPAEVETCRANVANGSEVYWLASDDYVLAGGIALTLDPPFAEVHSVYTAELYRTRGLASALIRKATSEAQKRGCTLIFALCNDEISARLYRRLGFADLDAALIYQRSVTASPRNKESPATYEHPLAQPLPQV